MATSSAIAVPATSKTVSTSFRDNVHKWIREDSEAKELYARWTTARKARDETEMTLVTALLAQGMNKAILQVNQGAIHMAAHTNSANLSFGMLEEVLPKYYQAKGVPDQTVELIAFVRTHRSAKTEYGLEFKPKKE